ncbi:DinI-like family protein [Entomohabitans teleogrylli]|uniref:DinI-like family protein n=1 Tax=Entomohabitans teleogrylli TaxID=1384589 RepID=UPI00073D7DDD|nr:DinI-like family protein [Entomohabitans teleogrylli]
MRVEISISRDKVKLMPKGAMEALREEMTKRLGVVYPGTEVIVKPGANDGLSVLWAANKDQSKKFVEETLQDTWESADDWFHQ